MSTTTGLSKINIVTKAEYDANAPYPDNELAMIPIGVMKGATASLDGESGFVPSPSAGDQEKVLKGNGTYAEMIHVSEYYSDENGNWYRKYSDGWVEQGGNIAAASFGGQSYGCPSRYSTQTFTFLVPFSSTDFDMKFTIKRTHASTQICSVSQILKSVTSSSAEVEFFREQDASSTQSVGGRWCACGMGA